MGSWQRRGNFPVAFFICRKEACNMSEVGRIFYNEKVDNGGVYVFDDFDEAVGDVSGPEAES